MDILSTDILSADILSTGILPAGLEVKIPAEAGIAFAPRETGSTFLENALIKADELHRLLAEKGILRGGEAVIADDSGICVDALGGRPGIHSAYYAGSAAAGGRGLNAAPSPVPSAAEQNALLLEELGDNPRRSARFVCAMVLYYSGERFFAAQETLEGEIVKSLPQGQGGFGYDPVLYLPELGRTVAELSAEEKNRLSHRGKAGRVIAGLLSRERLLGATQAGKCR